MIHTTIHRRRLPPPDPALSPVERAIDDPMHYLMLVQCQFSAAERRRIGDAMRTLRRAARGERVG